MRSRVTIKTGSRLHFGLLAHRPKAGRNFGGAGLMIDAPGVNLSAARQSFDDVAGSPLLVPRVKKIVARYRETTPADRQPPPCRVELFDHIPPHHGLGSGTQLALAVGKAMSLLAGEDDLSAEELARRVGRGARSALGLHGFHQGGFLVDGGKWSSLGDIGPLVSRVEFPIGWRMILISPNEETGLSGTKEQTAFDQLLGMPESLTNRLCRLVLMQLLPAVIEQDFDGFSGAVFEFGQEVGNYFAAIQGGRFASSQMGELAQSLRKQNIEGVGQSSWGPTLFALAGSQYEALDLLRELRDNPLASNCELQLVKPLNRGAEIQKED